MAVKTTKTKSPEYAGSIINTVREPLIVLDHNLRVITASRSFHEFFKAKPEEALERRRYSLFCRRGSTMLERKFKRGSV
jgi:two-component system, cell cycle sensor histidine kinase PleC